MVPANDAETVPDREVEAVAVVVPIGSLRDRDEPADHWVLGAHDPEQAVDLDGVARELGAEGDVASEEPDVCRLPSTRFSFHRPPPGVSSVWPSRT